MTRFSLDDWAGNGPPAYCTVPEDAQKLFWGSKILSIRALINFADILPSQSKVSSNLEVTAFYSDQPAVVSFTLHDLTKLQLSPADILHKIIEAKNQA
ncbi:hypothetical protein K439DRAFT_1641299 [Ramaria rubella]|nr:hypothetical protein K439DRAFT_1641299 [Ramaria rubella]